MNITNVTITRTAEEKTENAFYMLEYSTVNDELNHLHVSVNEKAVSYTHLTLPTKLEV